MKNLDITDSGLNTGSSQAVSGFSGSDPASIVSGDVASLAPIAPTPPTLLRQLATNRPPQLGGMARAVIASLETRSSSPAFSFSDPSSAVSSSAHAAPSRARRRHDLRATSNRRYPSQFAHPGLSTPGLSTPGLSSSGLFIRPNLATPAIARRTTPSVPSSWTGSNQAWKCATPASSRLVFGAPPSQAGSALSPWGGADPADLPRVLRTRYRLSSRLRSRLQASAAARRAAHPNPSGSSQAPARTGTHGFALIEMMLVIGTIMVVTGGIFAIYRVADGRQRTSREVQNAQEMANNLTNIMAASPRFSGVTQSYALANSVFPSRMVAGTHVNSAWGGVTVAPVQVAGYTDWGVDIAYNNVPTDACVSFVKGVSNAFYEIHVNGQVLRTNYARFSPTAAVNLCGAQSAASIDLIYAKNAAIGLATNGTSLCTAPPPDTQAAPCPSGQLGSLNQSRDYTCPSPTGAALAGAWNTTSSTCSPACVLPSPSTQTNTQTQVATQTLLCPAGQLSSVDATPYGIAQSQPQSQSQTRTASCPSPTGAYVWSPWTPWTPYAATAPWTTTSNTCAPQCVLPSPSTQTTTATQTETQTPATACPPGQSGSIVTTRTDVSTQTSTASCPAPTGPYAWSAYSPPTPWVAASGPSGQWAVSSNTCAPTCVAPPTSSVPGSQPASCPPGQSTPTGATSFTQTDTATTTYACPAPTGPYTTNPTTTTPWSPTVSSYCAPTCVAPPSTTAPATQTATCPPGTGVSGGSSTTFTQNATATTTYSCPTPNGPATSGVGYGPWTPPTSTYCVASCHAPTNTATPGSQTALCSPGQVTPTGASSFTQTDVASVTYACPTTYGPYTTTPSTTPWSPATSTYCQPACVAPPTLTAPASQTVSCPPGQVTPAGASTFTQSTTATTTYACPAPTGAYSTNPTTYGTWTPPATTACAPACVAPAPAPTTQPGTVNTQTIACPPGQLSTVDGTANGIVQQQSTTQSRVITYSCPAPTGAYTTNTPPWGAPGPPLGPWTTTANYCAPTCVAPPPSPGSQTATCPAGTGISGTSNTTFTQTNTTTYTCLAPTGAYTPNPSPWTPSTATACTPTCVAPPDAAAPPGSQTATCPPGYGVNNSNSNTFTQTAPTTTHYTCSATYGPATSAPVYGTWTPPTATYCVAACVAPPTGTQTQPASPATQSMVFPCPYGQVNTPATVGGLTQQRSVSQTSTPETYTCTNTYGTAYTQSPATPSWTGPTVYGPWGTTGNTCAPITPPSPAGTSCASPVANARLAWSTGTCTVPSAGTNSGPTTTPNGFYAIYSSNIGGASGTNAGTIAYLCTNGVLAGNGATTTVKSCYAN